MSLLLPSKAESRRGAPLSVNGPTVEWTPEGVCHTLIMASDLHMAVKYIVGDKC